MTDVAIGSFGRVARRPWYAMWRFVEARWYRGREYTVHVPYGTRILTPWFDSTGESQFAQCYRAAFSFGSVSVAPDRCYMLYQFAQLCGDLTGPWAECGVYTGGTAHLLCELIRTSDQPHRTLHLLDTFAGMPEAANADRDYHRPGDLADTSPEFVSRRLARYDFVEIHTGLIPDTFAEISSIDQYSFVHVDVDIYPSVAECCDWFWPRLARGGVMLFDDYGFYPYRRAARAAVDDYFAEIRGAIPLLLPTGQAFVIKR